MGTRVGSEVVPPITKFWEESRSITVSEVWSN
jgi:hypothetical protein